MRSPLARVLMLRSLLEDASRMELEKRAQYAARIEDAYKREKRLAFISRQTSLEYMTQVGPREGDPSENQAAREGRIVAEASWGMAEMRKSKLEHLLQAAVSKVTTCRDDFFVRRTERQQVEAVLAALVATQKIQQARRDQRALDDWFAITRARSQREDRAESPLNAERVLTRTGFAQGACGTRSAMCMGEDQECATCDQPNGPDHCPSAGRTTFP